MKTLITYTSTHGCTEKVANELKEKMGSEITMVNLKKDHVPILTDFDRIVIGGSIHAGQVQKRTKEFCTKNMDVLLSKEIGLFICCMYDGEVALKQLREAYPDELHQHAKTSAVLGGAYDFDKMNFFEKMVVKKVSGVKESVLNIDNDAIGKFAKKMDKIFNPFLFLA
jgi:menaquinone-dependent protoporphyrinogen oxidase